ncbi:MAG: hypothetical protein ACFFEA_05890 [Candidatus Thorarchaeota archaeon]
MTESSTPEDRLRRYKEFILGLQHSTLHDSGEVEPESNLISSESKKPPVKQELIAALAVLKRDEEDYPSAEETSARKNVLLRVKEKALESSMLEIRDERRRLERKLEKGDITHEEYHSEIQKLVRKGKSILKEQTIVASKKNGLA